ncbi:venom allergen 5-like protein [Aphelenchoides avenae]|nr:venom allergen 5-like protein [Aphelenchus avenae]
MEPPRLEPAPVVWARTHRLGCGACTTLTNPQKFFLVCDYFRAGNVLGQNTFTAGAQLGSNCPPGTAQGGSNGLCRVIDEAQFNTYAG